MCHVPTSLLVWSEGEASSGEEGELAASLVNWSNFARLEKEKHFLNTHIYVYTKTFNNKCHGGRGFKKTESNHCQHLLFWQSKQFVSICLKCIIATIFYPALLLADGTPTGGRGEVFLSRQPDFFTETAVTPERKVEKSFPRWEINRHVEG